MNEVPNHENGALHGYRILDLTHILNGPFCTMLLGHMGADVIKVEHGLGDPFRRSWMPTDADHAGYEFSAVNANKRGITLNLKSEAGRAVLLRFVECSDVVVENFSRGVLDRLGLGYDVLSAVNPRLIYASSRGYGETGPRADIRANAATIMASTGWTATAWDHAGTKGTVSLGIGDEAAGISMAIGIMGALLERERSGVGQKVEVAMQEALLGMMVGTLHQHFEGQVVGRGAKQCADGYVSFHTPAFTDSTWAQFAVAMGHPEAVDDPRFATVDARRRNFETLEGEVLPSWVRGKTRAELWQVFAETRISAAPVLTVAEVLEDEHLKERGAFVEIEDHGRQTTLVRPWIRFSRSTSEITRPAPAVGEHTVEVLRTILGMSDAEIDKLIEAGAV